MRGLPPLPTDVLALRLYIKCRSGECTTTHHVWNPGSSTCNVTDLQAFISRWFFSSMSDLLGVMPIDTSFVACRVSTSGPAHLSYQEGLAPNAGGFGNVTSLNAGLRLTWITGDAEIGSRGGTTLPLAEQYVDDNRQSVTAFAVNAGGSAASAYVNHVASILAVDGALCELVVVHQSADGAPLPSATYSPVQAGVASPRVATLRRRIPARSRISPF